MYIKHLSENAAKALGLDTEEKLQQFLKDQKEQADETHKTWLKKRLHAAQGEKTEDIPRGSYCYTLVLPEDKQREFELLRDKYGERANECYLFLNEHWKVLHCPYFQSTGKGRVLCHFLQVVSDGSWGDDDCEEEDHTEDEIEDAGAEHEAEDEMEDVREEHEAEDKIENAGEDNKTEEEIPDNVYDDSNGIYPYDEFSCFALHDACRYCEETLSILEAQQNAGETGKESTDG